MDVEVPEPEADPANVLDFGEIVASGPTGDPSRPQNSFAIVSRSRVLQVCGCKVVWVCLYLRLGLLRVRVYVGLPSVYCVCACGVFACGGVCWGRGFVGG